MPIQYATRVLVRKPAFREHHSQQQEEQLIEMIAGNHQY